MSDNSPGIVQTQSASSSPQPTLAEPIFPTPPSPLPEIKEPYTNAANMTSSVSTSIGAQSLNSYQKRLIIANWSHLNKTGSGGIGAVIFHKFLSYEPEYRQMFQKATVLLTFTSGSGGAAGSEGGPCNSSLPGHAKLLVELIDCLIGNLNNLDESAALCVRYGSDHAALQGSGKFNNASWDLFGQAMLESFTQLESVRKHKELVRAWMLIISFMIDKMRQGFSRGVRRLTYERSKSEFL